MMNAVPHRFPNILARIPRRLPAGRADLSGSQRRRERGLHALSSCIDPDRMPVYEGITTTLPKH